MNRIPKATKCAFLLLALLVPVALAALFENGGFEVGSFNHWTKSTFFNPGLSGSPPFTGASIVRTSGGSDQTQIVTASAPETGVDLVLGPTASLKFPKFGLYSARVNGPLTGNNSNTIKQQTTTTLSDIDPSDNQVHIRFAYAPVLQSAGHVENQQPFFYVALRNVTRGTLLYEALKFANQAGVPWIRSPYSTGEVLYTDWQIVDIAPGSPALQDGDTVELEVTAAGCSQGGHFGYVYVDGFGSQIPGLSVTKTATPSSVARGGELTYNFLYRNSGSSPVSNVVVKETIPADTTFVSVSDTTACSYASGIVTCNFGTMGPNDDGTFSIVVKVKPDATGTSIDNGNYTIQGTGVAPTLGPLVKTPIQPLSISKTASAPFVLPGGNLQYDFTYENAGSSAVSNVVVQETVPADTTFVSVSDTTACSHASGTVTCNFGTMSAGAQGTFSIVVAVSANPGGTSITNGNYTIQGTGVPATPGPTVTTPIQALSISKTASSPVALPGGNLQYDFTYRNPGGTTVSNVVVQEAIPADTAFVSVSNPSACSHAGGTVTCNFGAMSAGSQGTFSIVVAVSANPGGTSIANSNYTIQGTGVPARPGPPVTTPIQALSISKTASAPFVLPGGNLQYDFTYRNPGGTTVSNVVVQETVPADTTFVSVSDPTACSHASGTVTCNFGTMSAGSQGTFSIVVAVSANPGGTSITNSNYTVQGTGVPARPGPPVTTPIQALSISKTASAPFVLPGGNLQYDFTYRNPGGTTVSNVVVQETVPADTAFVSVSDPIACSHASGTVTCNFGTMSAGSQGTFSIVVAVSANPGGTSITNSNYTVQGTGVPARPGPPVTTPIQALSISKTASAPFVLPGGNLQYDFTYRNPGGTTVSNVVVQETVPADTAFVSVSDPIACSHASGTVTCNFGTMSAGSQGTFSIVVAVSANPGGTSITNNNYTIEGTGFPVKPGPPVTTPIQALSISKTANAPLVLPGGNLQYDFIYRNPGGTTVSNVVVQETVPADTTFVSVSDPTACSHASGIVTCNFGTMSPGDQGTFSIVVVVSANPGGTSIANNNYTIEGTGVPVTAGPPVTTPIQALSISKTASAPLVLPGGNLQYDFIYRNPGGTTVSNVVVQETVPADTAFVSVSDPTACSHASGTVTCNFGTMNPGDQGTFSIVVAVSATPGGTSISNNNYTVQGTGVPATAGPSVTTPIQALSISKTASAPLVLPGGNLQYDFTYRNPGGTTVSNVVVQETVPADTAFVSVSDPTACSQASGTVTCNVGTLNPGDQGTFSIVVAVSATPGGTSIANNNYTIEGTGVPVTPGPPVTTPIQVLSISKTASAPFALPGGNLQYDFTYRNPGGTTVSNVVVQETVPADTTFVSVSDPTACSHASGTVTCNVGTMNPGAQGTFSLVVAVSATPGGTSIANNNYTIEGTGVPATPGPPVTTPIQALSISKTPSATFALPGGILQYDFTYRNPGGTTVSNVVVQETVPADTTFVSVSDTTACSHASGTVTCNVGTLNPGDQGTFSIVVAVGANPDGTSIANNNYTIEGTGVPATPGPPVTTPITRFPALSISKTPNAQGILPGGNLQYDFIYTNIGTAAASHVVVSETIPSQTSFVSVSNSTACSHSSGVVTCNFGTLNAGDSGTFSVVVKVAPGTLGAIVNSTYSIAATGISPVAGAPVTVAVVPSIPTISSLGILVLVSLLALSGFLLLMKRQ